MLVSNEPNVTFILKIHFQTAWSPNFVFYFHSDSYFYIRKILTAQFSSQNPNKQLTSIPRPHQLRSTLFKTNRPSLVPYLSTYQRGGEGENVHYRVYTKLACSPSRRVHPLILSQRNAAYVCCAPKGRAISPPTAIHPLSRCIYMCDRQMTRCVGV